MKESRIAKFKLRFQVEREMLLLVDSETKLKAYKLWIFKRCFFVVVKASFFVGLAFVSPKLALDFLKSFGGY